MNEKWWQQTANRFLDRIEELTDALNRIADALESGEEDE